MPDETQVHHDHGEDGKVQKPGVRERAQQAYQRVRAEGQGSREQGEGQYTSLTVPDGPKMLRETLAVAQVAIGQAGGDQAGRVRVHVARLQRIIDECDRHRPLGRDGKHGDRHTPTCGCSPAKVAVGRDEALHEALREDAEMDAALRVEEFARPDPPVPEPGQGDADDQDQVKRPQPGDSFRVGGQVKRNLYWVTPQKTEGVDIGRIDHSPELAAWIVEAANNTIRAMVGMGEKYLNEILAERDQLRGELAEALNDVDDRDATIGTLRDDLNHQTGAAFDNQAEASRTRTELDGVRAAAERVRQQNIDRVTRYEEKLDQLRYELAEQGRELKATEGGRDGALARLKERAGQVADLRDELDKHGPGKCIIPTRVTVAEGDFDPNEPDDGPVLMARMEDAWRAKGWAPVVETEERLHREYAREDYPIKMRDRGVEGDPS